MKIKIASVPIDEHPVDSWPRDGTLNRSRAGRDVEGQSRVVLQ